MRPEDERHQAERTADGEVVDRRQLVRRALTFLGAAAAAMLVPSRADATDGDVVRVGYLAETGAANPVYHGMNTGTGKGLMVSAAQNSAVDAFTSSGASTIASRNNGVGHAVWAYGGGQGLSAVRAESPLGYGVEAIGDRAGAYAHSGKGDGVIGVSSAYGKSGIYAYNDVASYGYGVFARAKFAGVHGESERFGVMGVGLGTAGEATGCTGFGDKVGVFGGARNVTALGVHASNGYGGTGLKVTGRASFQRSGLATIPAGSGSVLVTVAGGVTWNSKILVTPQNSPGSGVFVQYATRATATSFRIQLNKAAAAACKLAWFVVD
jgi:hypothetical protein